MEYTKLSKLKPLPNNPRTISDEDYKRLVKSIKDNGVCEGRPLLLSNRTGELIILGGNQRYKACKELGIEEVPTFLFEKLTQKQEEEVIIRDNISNGEWDYTELSTWNKDDLNDWGLDMPALDGKEWDENGGEKGSMNDNFGLAPFSILNTTAGKWLEKKRKWLSLGIKSEEGRDGELLGGGLEKLNGMKNAGISVFDPVLTEIAYKWFNTKGGTILDPFAGGSVRGIVAATLGYPYIGNDLREEQVIANRAQATQICGDIQPTWTVGDSLNIKQLVGKDVKADMLFTCPPYADLEVYSNKAEDLSNMDYKDFKNFYTRIIKESCDLLKDNRFAVIVIGEVRAKNGSYYNLVPDTIKAFEDAGLSYYNELILVNSVGTLPMRAGRAFNSGRKIGKIHQNVLVFYKGDIKKIKDNFEPFTDINEQIETEKESEKGLDI